jgi:hypothetical protein
MYETNSGDPKIQVIHKDLGDVSEKYATDTEPYIAPIPTIFSFDYDITKIENNGNIYQNGSALATNKNMVTYPDLGLNINTNFGRYAANYYKGDLAEVIMFNRLLSDIERKDIERYLGKKWGIDVES